MVRVGDVARIIERHFPLHFALEGDNCGLQAGRHDAPVRGVLVALDPSVGALRRAVSLGADFLVTHHPLFHEPFRKIDTAGYVGAAAAEALTGDVAVYCAHTNLDGAPGGLAGELARRCGLEEVRPFGASSRGEWFKLVVFVPPAAAPRVHEAMSAAGAGVIGNYDRCAFMTAGEGVFRPRRDSRPTVGRRGETQRVPEVRLEMMVKGRDREPVIAAMKAAHPYEEVAWDLYPLYRHREGGLGCLGRRSRIAFSDLAKECAGRFGSDVRLSGRCRGPVELVAVVPGSGGGLLPEACRLGAQALVTGEVRYHHMTEAEHAGVGIVELGHDRSEMPAVDLLAGILRADHSLRTAKIKVSTFRRSRAGRHMAR